MGINVANEPDPRALGAYSFEAGAAPARRENVITSLKMAQDQSQFQQNLAANVAQSQNRMAADAAQQQANRNAELQSEWAKQQGYEKLNAQKKAEAELDREQQWQNAEANRRLTREKEFNDSVATGLKDGSLYYSPQQKQKLAAIDHGIAQVYGDASIAPDQQEIMAAKLHQQRRSIIPMVRPENERPVPLEVEMGQSTVVHTNDGRTVPLNQLGRALQPGEMVGTATMRNGTKQFKWDTFKPPVEEKPVDVLAKAWNDPVRSLQMEGVIRSQLQAKIDVDHKNEVAAWKQEKAAHDMQEDTKKKASDEYKPVPFTKPHPTLRIPTQEEVGHELFRRSQGLQGIKPPDAPPPLPPSALLGGIASAVSDAGAAVAGAMNPGAPPPAQPTAAPLLSDPIYNPIDHSGRKLEVTGLIDKPGGGYLQLVDHLGQRAAYDGGKFLETWTDKEGNMHLTGRQLKDAAPSGDDSQPTPPAAQLPPPPQAAPAQPKQYFKTSPEGLAPTAPPQASPAPPVDPNNRQVSDKSVITKPQVWENQNVNVPLGHPSIAHADKMGVKHEEGEAGENGVTGPVRFFLWDDWKKIGGKESGDFAPASPQPATKPPAPVKVGQQPAVQLPEPRNDTERTVQKIVTSASKAAGTYEAILPGIQADALMVQEAVAKYGWDFNQWPPEVAQQVDKATEALNQLHEYETNQTRNPLPAKPDPSDMVRGAVYGPKKAPDGKYYDLMWDGSKLVAVAEYEQPKEKK